MRYIGSQKEITNAMEGEVKLATVLLFLGFSSSIGQTLIWKKEGEWVKTVDNPSILVQDLSIQNNASTEYMPIRVGKNVEIVEIITGQIKEVFEDLPQLTDDSISNYYTFSNHHVDMSGGWFYLFNTLNMGDVPKLDNLHFALKSERGEVIASGKGEASFLFDGSSSLLVVKNYDSTFVYKFWGSAATKIAGRGRLNLSPKSNNSLSPMYLVTGRVIYNTSQYTKYTKEYYRPNQ